MSRPTVSVIVPNYNHARLLPRCLDALLGQSVMPDEILVMDDASTDNSLEVLRDYAARHPVIKVHPAERNQGVCAVMNRGLSLARGDYVCFPAADDRVLPGWLEPCVRLLAEHPQAGLVSGLSEWRCEDTGLVWHHGAGMPKEACYLDPEALVGLGRKGRFATAAQHALVKRAALVEAGGWIPELRWFTDCFGTWVVGFRHGMCHVPEVLSVFHTTRTSYFHSARSHDERRETLRLFIDLLRRETYADVAPRLRRSGLLGGLGWLMFRLAIADRQNWGYLNASFLRYAAWRSAEVVARRVLPNGLAALLARIFYGRG